MRGSALKSIRTTRRWGILLMVSFWSTTTNGVTWDVTTPPGQAYKISKFANLSAAGTGPMNGSTVVDVHRSGVVWQSASISTPPMGTQWSTTMSPPSGGWPVGVNDVRTFDGTAVDDTSYFEATNI